MTRETTEAGRFAQAWRRDGLALFGTPLLVFGLVAIVLPLLAILLANVMLDVIDIWWGSALAAPGFGPGQPGAEAPIAYPHYFFLGALVGMLPLFSVGVYWLALLRLRRGARRRSAWRAAAGLLALFCTVTFWLLGEEVAFTTRQFGPGYRVMPWTDLSWLKGTIAQEPAILLVGAVLILALSGNIVVCAALLTRRWPAPTPRSDAPRENARAALAFDVGVVYVVTTLLVIAQDLVATQINFAAINVDPQSGQPTTFGWLISVALFLAMPAALMVGATWHAWRLEYTLRRRSVSQTQM